MRQPVAVVPSNSRAREPKPNVVTAPCMSAEGQDQAGHPAKQTTGGIGPTDPTVHCGVAVPEAGNELQEAQEQRCGSEGGVGGQEARPERVADDDVWREVTEEVGVGEKCRRRIARSKADAGQE